MTKIGLPRDHWLQYLLWAVIGGPTVTLLASVFQLELGSDEPFSHLVLSNLPICILWALFMAFLYRRDGKRTAIEARDADPAP